MGKRNNFRYDNSFEPDIETYEILREGKRSVTYKMPDGNVFKIYSKEKRCIKEGNNLKKLKNYNIFPKVHFCKGNYLVREYIEGKTLRQYLKEKGMDEKTGIKLIDLILKFKKMGIKRIDIKLGKVYILTDGTLKVIPFKNSLSKKQDIPLKFLKGLKKLNQLEKFFDILKNYKPKVYETWKNYEKEIERKKAEKLKKKKRVESLPGGLFEYKEQKYKKFKIAKKGTELVKEDDIEFVTFESLQLKPFE